MNPKAAICSLVFAILLLTGFQQQNFPGSAVSCPYMNVNSGVAGSVSAPAQNASKVYAFIPGCTVTTSTISYNVGTADNTANTYDLGIYDVNGNLLTHTGLVAGTTLFPGGGVKSISWLTTVTLYSGTRYYFAWSTAAAAPTAALNGTSLPSPATAAAGPAPSSGALVTGTMPADSWATTVTPTYALR